MTIGARLKEERDRVGMSQTTFADLGGVKKGAQIAYETDRSSPTAAHLAAAEAHGVDVLYVITGRREPKAQTSALLPAPRLAEPPPKWGVVHPVSPDTTHPGAPPVGGSGFTLSSALLAPADVSVNRPMTLPVQFAAGHVREYKLIPRLSRKAAAGRAHGGDTDGGDSFSTDVAGVLAVEARYMAQALGREGGGFVTVTVSGDSMEPTLTDGEIIIVDTTRNIVDASGIYVVDLAGAVLVKRVQRRMDGSLVLMSDNPAYSEEHIQAGAVHTLRVLGRMTRLRFR